MLSLQQKRVVCDVHWHPRAGPGLKNVFAEGQCVEDRGDVLPAVDAVPSEVERVDGHHSRAREGEEALREGGRILGVVCKGRRRNLGDGDFPVVLV